MHIHYIHRHRDGVRDREKSVFALTTQLLNFFGSLQDWNAIEFGVVGYLLCDEHIEKFDFLLHKIVPS